MPVKDLNSLRFFRDVVKAGGFAAAERNTAQSRATLSRHVTALEDELGARLIERSTRSFRLTDQGKLLYDRSIEILAQLDEAVTLVEDSQHHPQGLVRVAIPPALLQLGVGQEILRYLQQAKDVRVQIEASNRAVDIRHEGVDFVIRIRTQMNYSLDLVQVNLAQAEHVIVAHPDYAPLISESIEKTVKAVPVITWTGISGESTWQLHNDQGEFFSLPLTPRLIVDDISTMKQAALSCIGIAIIPKMFVQDDINAGRLIEIEADYKPLPGIIHALHLGHHGMRPAVRHLLDWLKRVTRHLGEPSGDYDSGKN